MRALTVFALVLLAALPGAALAQDRVGYANVELILSLMPETKTAMAGVDSLGRQLSKNLDMKEAYAQKRVEEARAAQAKGATEQELDKYRTELRELEEEMRRDSEAADQKLAAKREEVVRPLLEKLQSTIREVAKAEGYTFVLNMTDGNGNSIVLYGADDRDLTQKILAKMGIEAPAKADAKADAKAPSKTDAKPGDKPKGSSGK